MIFFTSSGFNGTAKLLCYSAGKNDYYTESTQKLNELPESAVALWYASCTFHIKKSWNQLSNHLLS